MYKVYFLDGIREGDYDEVDELEDPWLQIKKGREQVYNLHDDPSRQLEEYRYSIFAKPVGGFEA
jgi:hypothetical protein